MHRVCDNIKESFVILLDVIMIWSYERKYTYIVDMHMQIREEMSHL